MAGEADARETPLCPEHTGAVLAVATVTYPDGQTPPALACSGCARNAIADALASGHAVRIDPVPSAYGICPRCGTSTRLRPASGLIGTHRDGWVKCAGQGQEPASPARPVQDVRLPGAEPVDGSR